MHARLMLCDPFVQNHPDMFHCDLVGLAVVVGGRWEDLHVGFVLSRPNRSTNMRVGLKPRLSNLCC
jgi:hypothetical protein